MIIPQPVSMNPEPGVFTLSPDMGIAASGEAEAVGRALRGYLSPGTGYALPVGKRGAISLRLDKKLSSLGAEGYRLHVQQDRVEITAGQPAGLFYGAQTFRQLLPVDVFRMARVDGVAWTAPCVLIEDVPRFSWRGAHLDVARHFMPKEFVLKYIDLLAMNKLNTLHFHLTDDQGWRIEIKKYPKLTSVGGWRKETMAGHYEENRFDGKPHGGFYTQEDIREIVAYARARFVNVVPEIEMPGHAQAAIAAYPELGNTGQQLEVGTRWGVIENVFNVNDSTIAFLQDVLTEVMTLFPSKFIHVGGDECPKTQWKESSAAQAKMKALGLKNEEELQSWFIHQMDQFLASHGRRLIGWDEILEGGLAPGATVMSWRGEEGGIAAANAGHDVVMTPSSYTYLDHYQAKDRTKEPLAIGGFLPLETVYRYEPVPAGISLDKASHVLGAQGQLWTEYIPDPKQLEYMAFPRLCALSEVVWSPSKAKDYGSFVKRLEAMLERLRILDVNYRPLDGPAQTAQR